MENFEEAEKIDQLRNKMLKYILYKKRTEMEVRQKFSEEDENAIEDAIEYFKELRIYRRFKLRGKKHTGIYEFEGFVHQRNEL